MTRSSLTVMSTNVSLGVPDIFRMAWHMQGEAVFVLSSVHRSFSINLHPQIVHLTSTIIMRMIFENLDTTTVNYKPFILNKYSWVIIDLLFDSCDHSFAPYYTCYHVAVCQLVQPVLLLCFAYLSLSLCLSLCLCLSLSPPPSLLLSLLSAYLSISLSLALTLFLSFSFLSFCLSFSKAHVNLSSYSLPSLQLL